MSDLKLYQWKATNRLQQKQKGKLVAKNENIARQILFQKGMQQIRLQRNWQFSFNPKSTEICDLLTQLAILLKSSVPLKQSLNLLMQNCTNIALNAWLRNLLTDIENGFSFSQSLEKQGKYLNYQECQLIYVGEMTGKLTEICQQISVHRQQSLVLQRKIQKILLYPVMVLAISVVITTLLLIFIVPKFSEMYMDKQVDLPAFTNLLLILSEVLQQYILHIGLLVIIGVMLIRFRLQRSIWLNKQKDRLVSFIPILNNIAMLSRLVNFCRSLSLMINSGIPLKQGLQSFLPKPKIWQVSAKIQGDLWLQTEVKSILNWINQGYAFSDSVGSNLFTMEAQQMLQVGEKSGELALVLEYIAENNKQKLDHQIDLLSQMLEPLLMVIIGGIIGMIMLGMYLPIFNMGSLI
ncbi:protein transport protein HofC [Bisgaardia hudsonensis]|uniref:Protein transport protein HofC n=1 Tax=Bisgaardia hudsonensis TaxID=109472 RepID=A0A4V2SJ44_9PAST|nr:type II secretion system F family protein [Bisgaardia hudsonensis]QLB13523.1 type II secretion system protein F [Bisgaardia hudsonensis]TCP12938.1 protein transport protein HofC [Bisgaardia hudsonensis]